MNAKTLEKMIIFREKWGEGVMKEIIDQSELGFLHKAQSNKAKPLVYDYMEWVRPILVDRVIITFLNKKKKRFEKLSPKDIKYFIYLLKNNLDKKYYNYKLGYYITLKFWVRLSALKLLHAIKTNKAPNWNFPTMRHESRLIKIKQKTPDISSEF